MIKIINVIFFQWFFVRLIKKQEKIIENYTLQSYDIMADGNISSRGVGKIKVYQYYGLQYWILPCSGWWNDLIYLNKKTNIIKIKL
jgi:hypothetical protein